MNGTIKNCDTTKMFGFIRGADGIEYFFHKSAFEAAGDGIGFSDLSKGMPVTFIPGSSTASPKGPRAELVRVMAGARPD